MPQRFASIYRMRVEAADGETAGPWCWHWVECDICGFESDDDPRGPFEKETQAVADAIVAGFKPIRGRKAA